jgi:hypothetical protein
MTQRTEDPAALLDAIQAELDRRREAAAERERQTLRDYAAFLTRLVKGEDVDPAEALDLLAALGLGVADLEKDVAARLEAEPLVPQLLPQSEVDARTAAAARIDEEMAAARPRTPQHDALAARRKAACDPLDRHARAARRLGDLAAACPRAFAADPAATQP